MRQINFGLIFGFGLITVFFTLENTSPTTVQLFQGWTTPCLSLDCCCWWPVLVPLPPGSSLPGPECSTTLNQFSQANEYEAQQVRIQELETDLNRYRSTVETQLGLLPATTSIATMPRAPTTTTARPDTAKPWHLRWRADTVESVQIPPC